MSDDFIVEDQERAAGSPFIIMAGILGAVFVLGLICIATILLTRDNGTTEDPTVEQTRIAILATNDAVMTINAQVTETVVARTLTAAAPTLTPTPLPTATATQPATATFTPTPAPSETPVISTGKPQIGRAHV